MKRILFDTYVAMNVATLGASLAVGASAVFFTAWVSGVKEARAAKDRVALDNIARVLSESTDWGSEESEQIFHIVEQVRAVDTYPYHFS